MKQKREKKKQIQNRQSVAVNTKLILAFGKDRCLDTSFNRYIRVANSIYLLSFIFYITILDALSLSLIRKILNAVDDDRLICSVDFIR